jgi:hypothetical protein
MGKIQNSLTINLMVKIETTKLHDVCFILGLLISISRVVIRNLRPVLNLLKPTGYLMHQQFQLSKTVRSAHTVFMCFVFISEQAVTFALYNIN